jgi:hypothetical protein
MIKKGDYSGWYREREGKERVTGVNISILYMYKNSIMKPTKNW